MPSKACETLLYPAVSHILRLIMLPGEYHNNRVFYTPLLNRLGASEINTQYKIHLCAPLSCLTNIYFIYLIYFVYLM